MRGMEWNGRSDLQKFLLLVATGMGLGLSPVASGTTGALLGVVIAGGLCAGGSWLWHTATALALTVLAVPVCGFAERHFGRKDDGRIVADEYMTFPICAIGLPPTALALGIAFVTNRIFDILKPPPANGLQRLPGGWGIVVDDVIAALYSLAVNHALYWWLGRQFGWY